MLGRGLDVSVLASLEPQEDVPESSCFSADVFYGDTRVNPSGVTVTPLRTSPTELTLRVRSSTPIDEPFITLYVRAACSQSVTRRYVLLSDSPSEPAPLVQIPALPLLGSPTPLRAPAVTDELRREDTTQMQESKARQANRAVARQEAINQKPQTSALDPVASEQAQARRVARQKAKEQAKLQATEYAVQGNNKTALAPLSAMSPSLGSAGKTSTDRLKVDLLDLVPGREPSLRASAELLSQPTTDMATRAQAAAVWRMINASPQDMLRDVERLKTIETEVRAMSELTKRQTQELTAVKTELATAQRDRYANPFVYVLAALCLGALAFAAWMWRQRRSSHAPWWGNQQSLSKTEGSQSKGKPIARFGSQNAAFSAEQEREREQDFVSASQLITPASGPMPLGDRAGPPPSFISSRRSAVDFDVQSGHSTSELVSPAPDRLNSSSAARGIERDFESSAMTGLRPVKAEELFDIQQQADFFMSLGQHAQAIDILQNHIGENVETSALAYLDLFDIYHSIDQRTEFADLRAEFNRVFNAQVPEFDQYGIHSRGLEDYVPVLQRIQALWPNAKVLEVIEESIFRKPDFENQPFDLLAYRELMLLYAIAKDVSEYDDAGYDIEENPDVDFDVSQPGELESGAMAGVTTRTGLKDLANTGLSGTGVQSLSASLAHPIAHSIPSNEVFIDEEWERALKNVPLLNTSIGVDVDIGAFADAPVATDALATSTPAPTGVPSLDFVSSAQVHSKVDNGIDFEIALDEIQSSSKKPKL